MNKRLFWRLIPMITLAALLTACGPNSRFTELASPVISAIQPVTIDQSATLATPVALNPDKAFQTLPEDQQDTFRIALSENIDSFDPLFAQTSVSVLPFMMETLTRLSSYGEIEPLLAFSWEISEDGLTYTFNLQTGVFFSDGTPFNADAVKFNLERFQALNPPMISSTVAKNLREIEIVDDHQIKLHLNAPSNDLLMALSDVHLSILSPASIPPESEDYKNIDLLTPYGTGPFILYEYNGIDRLTLHRNLNYWNFAPTNDIIIIQSIADVLMRENMLLNNEIDLTVDLPPEDVNILTDYDTVVVQEGQPFRQVFIGINTSRPFMDNAPVRQALNYAMDQQAIVNDIMKGRALTSTSLIPQGFIGSCQANPPYTQDLGRAASLLNEVGIPQNMPLKLILPAGRIQQGEQVAEAAANYLRAVGFQVTVEALDWESYMAALNAPYEERDYDLYLFEWAGNIPHSNDTLQLLRSDSPLNASLYSNPEVDAWIRSASSMLDEDEANDSYCNLSQFIWQEAPWIFLYQQDDPVIYSTRFTNIGTLPGKRFKAIYAEPIE
jgi:peptide/nickel transport system substrate-binding protein